MTRKIPLTQGKYAVVDDEDFIWLSEYKWFYHKGYAVRKKNKRHIYMHREINQTPPDQMCDHADGDGLNNQRRNLRNCTNSQNQANGRLRVDNTSQYKGVARNKSRGAWFAQIRFGGKRKNLGHFDDPADAARAYDTAAKELYGEFAKLNFPDTK